MEAQQLKHYDARCPQCRKVNRISQTLLLRAAPDWGKEEEPSQTKP
jgi:phage FluMu protein Com